MSAALLRAWVAFRNGRPRSAEAAGREYEGLLLRHPERPAHLTLLSRYYADGPGERNPDKAELAAREALSAAPADCGARLALGIALYRQGKVRDAEAELAPLADRPSCRTVGLVRAAIAARCGRVEDAHRLLAAAVGSATACEPNTPEWEAEARRALAEQGE
jgi:predicted Zn-dependent protease